MVITSIIKQHMVDWNSGMISQISKLGSKYEEWVNLPVDRHLKLFSNPLLESLSRVKFSNYFFLI